MGWGPGEKTNSTKSTTERGTSTWYVSKRARKVWVMQTISEVVDSARPGDSYVLKLHYRPPSGRRTPYRLTFPLDFTPSVEVMPLLVFFHGWTSSHDGRESIAMHDYGRRTGILVVSPTGFEDLRGGPSWNGSGTVGSPGPAGRTCYDPHNSFNLCYDSCGHCADTCWVRSHPPRALSRRMRVGTHTVRPTLCSMMLIDYSRSLAHSGPLAKTQSPKWWLCSASWSRASPSISPADSPRGTPTEACFCMSSPRTTALPTYSMGTFRSAERRTKGSIDLHCALPCPSLGFGERVMAWSPPSRALQQMGLRSTGCGMDGITTPPAQW